MQKKAKKSNKPSKFKVSAIVSKKAVKKPKISAKVSTKASETPVTAIIKKAKKKEPSKTQFRKIWTDALRSGKYRKGVGNLKKAGRYCCLGVACELYNEHFNDVLDVSKISDGIMQFGDEIAFLPSEVQSALGMSDESGRLQVKSTSKKEILKETAAFVSRIDRESEKTETSCLYTTCLSTLNDEGLSFSKIADLIDAKPEGLFD